MNKINKILLHTILLLLLALAYSNSLQADEEPCPPEDPPTGGQWTFTKAMYEIHVDVVTFRMDMLCTCLGEWHWQVCYRECLFPRFGHFPSRAKWTRIAWFGNSISSSSFIFSKFLWGLWALGLPFDFFILDGNWRSKRCSRSAWWEATHSQ